MEDSISTLLGTVMMVVAVLDVVMIKLVFERAARKQGGGELKDDKKKVMRWLYISAALFFFAGAYFYNAQPLDGGAAPQEAETIQQ